MPASPMGPETEATRVAEQEAPQRAPSDSQRLRAQRDAHHRHLHWKCKHQDHKRHQLQNDEPPMMSPTSMPAAKNLRDRRNHQPWKRHGYRHGGFECHRPEKHVDHDEKRHVRVWMEMRIQQRTGGHPNGDGGGGSDGAGDGRNPVCHPWSHEHRRQLQHPAPEHGGDGARSWTSKTKGQAAKRARMRDCAPNGTVSDDGDAHGSPSDQLMVPHHAKDGGGATENLP